MEHGFLYLYVRCRETQAKAKRFARFKVELGQSVQSSPDIANRKIPSNRPDHDGLEQPSIIIGLCPDMCPGMSLIFLVWEQICKFNNFSYHPSEF